MYPSKTLERVSPPVAPRALQLARLLADPPNSPLGGRLMASHDVFLELERHQEGVTLSSAALYPEVKDSLVLMT